MMNRLTLSLAVRLTLLLAGPLRRVRTQPDRGMETADKILWAAATTLIVGVVGGVFKDKLTSFAEGLSVTLGWK
jgi:hypothetical protein